MEEIEVEARLLPTELEMSVCDCGTGMSDGSF
jgi:hypothetical protein